MTYMNGPFSPITTSTYWNGYPVHNVSGTGNYYDNWISGTGNYYDWMPRNYARPMSRRERALAAERVRLAKEIRRFGDSVLVQRVARAEREKKVLLDAVSRARSAPPATRKQDARRLQTFDAAMHERTLRR